MRRVSVVGISGSGKSTLARRLAAVIDVPYLELDSVFHQPGWTELPDGDFRRRVGLVVEGGGWVVDGNYSRVLDLVWARADTVVWLDLPRRRVMRQVVTRTVRRVVTRQELWNGNREPWSNLWSLDPSRSIIAWAWTRHAVHGQRFRAAMADPANSHLCFVRLASRREASRWLAALGGSGGQPPTQ